MALETANLEKVFMTTTIWLALDLLKIASCSHTGTLVSVKNLVHASYIGEDSAYRRK